MALRPSLIAAQSLRVLPRKRMSRAMGRLADLEGPGPLVGSAVRAFVRAYGVNLDEAVIPPEGFASFDAFFTRRLRDGARPIDADPAALLSPSDGVLTAAGTIRGGEVELIVKGRPYRVDELLGSASDASEFEGGSFALIYLAPKDYHRVHAPASGAVTSFRYIAGTLYPVNSIGVTHFPRLFAENERVVVRQDTERHGRVATVLVGAVGVGRIGVSFDSLLTNTGGDSVERNYSTSGAPVPHLERGGELGVFHLGSTVVLFVPRDAKLRWQRRPGDTVRMGEALARLEGAR